MAGEAKSIGDLIVTIRSEGDEEEIRSKDLIESVDNLTDVVRSFGRFMMVQSVVLDRFVKQSDSHIKELVEDLKRSREESSVRNKPKEPKEEKTAKSDKSKSGDKDSSSLMNLLSLGGLTAALIGTTIGVVAGQLKAIRAFSPKIVENVLDMLKTKVVGVIVKMTDGIVDAVVGLTSIFRKGFDLIKKAFELKLFKPFVEAGKVLEDILGIGGKTLSIFSGIKGYLSVFGSTVSRIAGIVGKIFAPISIILTAFDTIKGALDGYAEGGFIGALEGGITGFFNSLIFAPLDLVKNIASWIIGKLGFDNAAEILDSFSFADIFSNLVGGLFDTLVKTVTDVVTVFQEEGFSAGMWNLITECFSLMVTKPLDLIKDLAAWVAEQFGFEKAAEWLSSFSLDEAFRSFGDWIASIPQKLIDFAEEMWIDLWAKFKKGLVSLGAWIASIPDRIYLNAIDYLNNTSGVGYLIDDEAVAEAQRAVQERNAGTAETLRQIELDAENQRRSLAERQAARVTENAVAATAGRAAAAPVYAPTSVNTGGNNNSSSTTYNTVINPHTGLDSQPYLLGGR